MKLIIELPDNLLDMRSLEMLGFLNEKMEQAISREIKEQIVDRYIEQFGLDEIRIDKKELKQAVVEKMAERAIDRLED